MRYIQQLLKICKGSDDSVEVILVLRKSKYQRNHYIPATVARVGHTRSVRSYEVSLRDNVHKDSKSVRNLQMVRR